MDDPWCLSQAVSVLWIWLDLARTFVEFWGDGTV